MSFIDNLTARLPFSKKEEAQEYFFALQIGPEKLTVAIWTIDDHKLKILNSASDTYSSTDELKSKTDKLLDLSLGDNNIEPDKILFGVPDSWLQDENLKDPYLKILRDLVKDLELTPMAYVSTAHAIAHLLEKQEGVPTTAILVGIDKNYLTAIVARAGKLDGSKTIKRGNNIASDLEKALLSYTDVEVLPSKILIFGDTQEELAKYKDEILSFPWMSKLSFLHFPKVEILEGDVDIESVAFAGASELDDKVIYHKSLHDYKKGLETSTISQKGELLKDEPPKEIEDSDDFGFVVGDIGENENLLEVKDEGTEQILEEPEPKSADEDFERYKESEVALTSSPPSEITEKEQPEKKHQKKFFALPLLLFSSSSWKKIFKGKGLILGIILILFLLAGSSYIFLPQAKVKVFVEPRILERDTQVTADPSVKEVKEDEKKIPGQIVETEISGSAKDQASGKKQIGDPAKGTIVLRNKTSESKSVSKGAIVTTSNGLKFTLDTAVSIASQSADDGTWGKATATVTAQAIGADSNLPSDTDLTVSSVPTSEVIAKAEGNFSGGTSKEVTVVSDADQKRLLASLASTLKKQAQQQLQEKLPEKKILEEALSEEIVKRSYNKNVNDQANEFSLNMTVRYKGTAFEDKDLKTIVSKLVSTNIPEDFQINLAETETQSDVSKVEKDGRLVFLARFKAKLMPKIDTDKIKKEIAGNTPEEAANNLKKYENILGSEIEISPNMPKVLQRLPILTKNINVEVGLK